MIVPASKEHFVSMYGEIPVFTMRAYSMLNDDGEVIGIGGIYHSYGSWVAFVNLSEEALKRRKNIIKLKRSVMPLMRGKKVYAIRDASLETSEAVLKHFGFQHLEGNQWLGYPM